MSRYNFAGGANAVTMLAAINAANTAAATGTGIDLRDYEGGPIAIVQNKGAGTGTLTGKVQDSDDNASFADVTTAGVTTTFTQSGTGADTKVLVIDPLNVRRYVRYVGTVGTGQQLVSVTMIGMKKAAQ